MTKIQNKSSARTSAVLPEKTQKQSTSKVKGTKGGEVKNFHEYVEAIVSIRSFNDATRYLQQIDQHHPNLANLTSMTTCRAIERFTQKRIKWGEARNAIFQELEDVRRARDNGQMNEALNHLMIAVNKVNSNLNPEFDEYEGSISQCRTTKQFAKLDRKGKIIQNLSDTIKNVICDNLLIRLRNLKEENRYQDKNCLSDEAIELFREINRVINGDVASGGPGNGIDKGLIDAKKQKVEYDRWQLIFKQIKSLSNQIEDKDHPLFEELNKMHRDII